MHSDGWRIGKEPCTQLIVKGANIRLQRLAPCTPAIATPCAARRGRRLKRRAQGEIFSRSLGARALAGRGLSARLAPAVAGRPPHAARPRV